MTTLKQLANCMLLTQQENGAGGKSDTLPEVWFHDKDDAYLDMHMIPKDSALWGLDRFEDFISERKSIILSRFAYLVSTTGKSIQIPDAVVAASTNS